MQIRLESKKMLRSIAAGIAIVTVIFSFNGSPPGMAQLKAGTAAQQAQAAAPTSFEVASIKPSDPSPNGMFMVRIGASPGGRWTASGITVGMLIQQAYDVRDYQISGAPSWLNSERYDIVAKADVPNITRDMAKVLLQSLLAERFNLKIHRETKELPIYALVIGKDGHKLHESETQPTSQAGSQPPDPSKPVQKGTYNVGAGGTAGAAVSVGPGGKVVDTEAPVKSGSMIRMGRGQLSAQMTPVSAIAAMLAQQLGRPVIDKTDIKGNFDFSLQWTPDETQRGPGLGGMDRPATDSPLPSDTSGPSIFTAVQEQLGLRLEATKGPVEILVIDHVEKASGN
ncbi:MAG: TIGR03435 family protein [Acidobacteriota bacterium]